MNKYTGQDLNRRYSEMLAQILSLFIYLGILKVILISLFLYDDSTLWKIFDKKHQSVFNLLLTLFDFILISYH